MLPIPSELMDERVWSTESAHRVFDALGQAVSRRTVERHLRASGLWPDELSLDGLRDAQGRFPNRVLLGEAVQVARAKRHAVLLMQLHALADGSVWLHANDPRGARLWVRLQDHMPATVSDALARIQAAVGKTVWVFPHGALVDVLRDGVPGAHIHLCPGLYPPILQVDAPWPQAGSSRGRGQISPYLRRLEAESIHILREAVAEAQNPAMLFSVGKDSCVMLHLARKAFHPGPPPFPLLHVDTRWKFQEMYLFRDWVAQQSGLPLLVHTNPEAVAKDINPFDHGSALHTDITKTEGLKQALDLHGFDVVFGGARRDEEKSRAKERIFSFRTASHRWDPKNQRPELWDLFNTRKHKGESIRVFPLSNWTELDVWQYIAQESIPVAPLYFAQVRPVVERNGLLLMVDDDRFRRLPGEPVLWRQVRFRTLGCYPLTGAVESSAHTVADIVAELQGTRHSERQGRAIDSDGAASMERKKQEGYF